VKNPHLERKLNLKRILYVEKNVKKAIQNLYNKHTLAKDAEEQIDDIQERIEFEEDKQLSLKHDISLLKEKLNLMDTSKKGFHSQYFSNGGGVC
jgi:predicted RNA binding protein with dsRBD fold (UPF0201 family)